MSDKGRSGAPARIAVMVDADQIEAVHAPVLDALARQSGRVVVRRAYGNLAEAQGWLEQTDYRCIHRPPGPGSGAVPLAIDAMDLAAGRMADRFLIGSADPGLAALVLKLVEAGFPVEIAGPAPIPQRLAAVCEWAHPLAPPAGARSAAQLPPARRRPPQPAPPAEPAAFGEDEAG